MKFWYHFSHFNQGSYNNWFNTRLSGSQFLANIWILVCKYLDTCVLGDLKHFLPLTRLSIKNMKTFQGESQANGTNIMCYRTSKKEKPVAFTSQEVRHEVSLEG